MESNHQNQAELQKLLLWISNHVNEWELICTLPRENIGTNRLLPILDSLMEQELYQIVLVTLTACLDSYAVDLTVRGMVFLWLSKQTDDACREWLMQVLAEIKSTEKTPQGSCEA